MMPTPAKLHPALLGGLFIGVVSALPYVKGVNSCCCLWLAVGGLLAAWVMQQNHPAPVTLADGARVGLFAGLIGFPIMLIVSIPMAMLTGPDASFSPAMLDSTEGMTPEVRAVLRSIPPAAFALLGGALFLGVGSIVSTVGGVIGAALFRRGAPAAPPPLGPPPFESLPPEPPPRTDPPGAGDPPV